MESSIKELSSLQKDGIHKHIKRINKWLPSLIKDLYPDQLFNIGTMKLSCTTTLLHLFACYPAINYELLIENNTSNNRKDSNGYTALYYACQYSNVKAARLLLQNRADPNIVCCLGTTPLTVLCNRQTKSRIEILKLLIEYRVDVNPRDSKKLVVPIRCLLYEYYDARKMYSSDRQEFLSFLIELLNAGSTPNYEDEQGQNALHIACLEGDIEVCRILLENGCDYHWTDQRGERPENKIGDPEIRQQFLQLIKECNAPFDLTIITPYSKDIVEQFATLLKYGGQKQINQLNILIPHLIQEIAPDRRLDIFMYARDTTLLHFLARYHFVHYYYLFRQDKVDCNIFDAMGNSPLHYACETVNTRVIKVLLENGANPNLFNRDGASPLVVVCGSVIGNKLQAIEILIKHGADSSLEYKSFDRYHSLFWSLITSRCDLNYRDSDFSLVLEKILEKGCNVNHIDNEGRNALHLLCSQGDLVTATTLVFYGCNYGLRSKGGKLPVEQTVYLHLAYPLLDMTTRKDLDKFRSGATTLYEKPILMRFRFIFESKSHQYAGEAKQLLPFLIQEIDPDTLVDLNLSGQKTTLLHQFIIHLIDPLIDYNLLFQNSKKPINCNIVDDLGRVPLHLACERYKANIVRILLEHGADPNMVDNQGNTCLSIL